MKSAPPHGGPPGASSREETDPFPSIDFARLPRHVAIIMDGNGRWARQRRLPRIAGHRAGIAAVRDVVEASARLGLEVLTLYAFSRENWSRPAAEVNALMRLLREYLDAELPMLQEKNIRFRAIGRLDELPRPVREALGAAEQQTARNTGMVFLIALSYSARTEIADAARALARDAVEGRITPDQVDEDVLAARLATSGLPDPDLLIRTSGEMRVSNFLLWQLAYAELWVTTLLWPDFRRQHLHQAIADFQGRERRFGRVEGGGDRARGPRGARRLITS